MTVHLPLLRTGKPYRSLDTVVLSHVRTGDPVAEVSQANRGLIARDLDHAGENRRILAELSAAELLSICKKAATLFMTGELELDQGVTQSAEDFVRQQSSTTGMPEALCRGNMEKIHFVLDEMERVLAGLTRGLDPVVLDKGYGEQDGRTVAYLCQANSLGAVLPSNSPGVHALWLPSLALKVPVVLKPGRQEPWTALRIARAFEKAGCPPGAVGFYPTNHGGAAEILVRCDRSMLFGDGKTLDAWRTDSRVQLHGPGWSKVLLGPQAAENWHDYLDIMVTSVAANGGRSCVNASGVWTTAHGREIAEALAERLASIEARGLEDPAAELAAFSTPGHAHAISEFIDQMLQTPGAEDLTARHRGNRVAEVDGCTFLLPTVIWCTDPAHPLAASEFLFPFVVVVETSEAELLPRIGSTLVGTAPDADGDAQERLLSCTDIERLNLGAIPTCQVSWDQPHEGNIFQHLYRQRAVQAAGVS